MKETLNPDKKISLQMLESKIVRKAREGAFGNNPLLATLHQAVCKPCGCAHEMVYLRYLKSGKFETGDTQMVEMFYTHLTIPEHITEKVAPIIFKFKSGKCRTEAIFSLISREYVMYTASRPPKLEITYA